MILKHASEVTSLPYQFESPVDLNDSQTEAVKRRLRGRFESPVDLNDSQTPTVLFVLHTKFESPVDLNDSQTSSPRQV